MSDFEKDLIAMIYHLKNKKPALYLGSHSITALNHFIGGFMFGYSFPKIRSFAHFFHNGFQEYIENKYIGYKSARGWCVILLEQSGNDEGKALDLFFDEFEMYLNNNHIETPIELSDITFA